MQNYREETRFGKPFCCDVFKDAQRACTFAFPSRVNPSPSLYCIARTLGKKGRHSIGQG